MLVMQRSRLVYTPATDSGSVGAVLQRSVVGAILEQPSLEYPDEVPRFGIVRHPLDWYREFYKTQDEQGWPVAEFDRTVAMAEPPSDNGTDHVCDPLRFNNWVERILEIEQGFQTRQFRDAFGRNLDEITPVLYERLPLSITEELFHRYESFDRAMIIEGVNQFWNGYRSTEHFWHTRWRNDGVADWQNEKLVRDVVLAEAPIVSRFYGHLDYVKTLREMLSDGIQGSSEGTAPDAGERVAGQREELPTALGRTADSADDGS